MCACVCLDVCVCRHHRCRQHHRHSAIFLILIHSLTAHASSIAAEAFEDPSKSRPLQTAMRRVAAMPAFMLTERYDESVELLAHTFCWSLHDMTYRPPYCNKQV